MTAIDSHRDLLLRQALQPSADCPPLAELVEAVLTGAVTPRAEALRAHAAGCSSCTAEVELAGAFDATSSDAAEAGDIAWVAARLQRPVEPAAEPRMARVLPMDPKRSRRAARASLTGEGSLWSRWAAAALIVVGLGLTFEWGHRTFAPALPEAGGGGLADVVRSGELRLDAPLGVQATLPTEFSWRAVTDAAAYRVEVRDVAGDLLWQGESAAPALATPSELRSKLESFVTYRWTVTALDASSRTLATSAPASFRFESAAN